MLLLLSGGVDDVVILRCSIPQILIHVGLLCSCGVDAAQLFAGLSAPLLSRMQDGCGDMKKAASV
ncbi:hypothetical protein DZB54_16810 [Herbaspirillum sp. 3R-3a1]|nr:hypothetical protein DZB54_16810 [Herbaspirillum sp. 3R-3a1]